MRFRNGHAPKPHPQEELEACIDVGLGDAVYIKLKNSALEAAVLKINADGTYTPLFLNDTQAAKLGLRRDSIGRLLMANY